MQKQVISQLNRSLIRNKYNNLNFIIFIGLLFFIDYIDISYI
jgi:hypothetical protein